MKNVLTDPTKSKHQSTHAPADQNVNPSTAREGRGSRAFASAQRNPTPPGVPRPYSLGEAKKTKTKRDIGGGEGAEARVRAAQAARRALLEAFEARPPVPGLRIFAVSTLTAPDPSRLRHAAERAADCLRPGEGLILVLDVSEKERAHLHGLAILEDDERFLDQWVAAADADHAGQRLTKVTGSDGAWDTSNERLRQNLDRVLAYAFRRKEPAVSAWLSMRIVTGSGALKPMELAARLSLLDRLCSGDRQCQRCSKTLRKGMRKHAKWCGPSCRVLASKARCLRRAGK